ncbi:Oidioi.mRNA.OKI2018_I69.chr1.g2339.t1.cds [Oikopleura dioica]|uniref:Oidioi.mRNA.OKI2018_I69.chr1.g2339.t1.cds n=1 Tax=Oikopleura dioica TaxID=34765 RepID=A0ABN7SQT0_OIKDI|nr:Oidioi.mRNA.OKI2018_I69.chr1.g2339.t1.cds [Oikopleura dioica]
MNDFANEFPNIDKTDLNKVWGILSNLQNNNPQKYKKFMDHIQASQKKMIELEKIRPIPKVVYQIDAANIDKFKWHVNILAWERMQYPKADGPLSLMAGAKLVKLNKTEIASCIAINPKVFEEISDCPEMEKEFKQLVAKFVADNYKEYRFFPNTIKTFKMKDDSSEQFFGPKPTNLIDCFRKTTGKADQDLLSIIKEDPKEDAPEPEKNSGPKDMIEALTYEMKEAKIIASKEEEKSQPKEEPKKEPEEKTKKLRPQTPKARRKPIIEEIPEKVEPKILTPEHKTDDKHADYWKVQIALPGVNNPAEINSACSASELRIEVSGKYMLSIPLPRGLKDETAKARFSNKKETLTMKIMREQSKTQTTVPAAEEFVDKNFMENIRKAMSPNSPSARGTAQVQ